MPDWSLDIKPGGARGSLSAPSMYGGGGGGNFGPMMDMLRQKMKMQERSEKNRLAQIQQQMAEFRNQARMSRAPQGGLKGPNERSMRSQDQRDRWDEAYKYASGMIHGGQGGWGGEGTDLKSTEMLARQIYAMGPERAHEGSMQYGRLMAGMAGQVAGAAGQQGSTMAARGINPQSGLPFGQTTPYSLARTSFPMISGQSAEKGGRVPKTGTYKLHKGETVIPKKLSDVILPSIAKGRKSKGKARAGYQAGKPEGQGIPLSSLIEWYRSGGVGAPPTSMVGPMGPTGWSGGPSMPGGMIPGGPSGPGGFTGGPATEPFQLGPGRTFTGASSADDLVAVRSSLTRSGKSTFDDAIRALAKGNADDVVRLSTKLKGLGKYGKAAAALIGGAALAYASTAGTREDIGSELPPPLPGGAGGPGFAPPSSPPLGGGGPMPPPGLMDELGQMYGGLGDPQERQRKFGYGVEETQPPPAMYGPTPMDQMQPQPGPPQMHTTPPLGPGPPPPQSQEITMTEEPLSDRRMIDFMGQQIPSRQQQMSDYLPDMVEPGTVKSFTGAGKPFTEEEKQQNEIDQIQRDIQDHKQQAASLNASAMKYQSWARKNPNSPSAEMLRGMAMDYAKQSKEMLGIAATGQKMLDDKQSVVTQAEALAVRSQIEAGGRVGAAQIGAEADTEKAFAKTSEGMTKELLDYYRENDPDLFEEIMNRMIVRMNPQMGEFFGTGAE